MQTRNGVLTREGCGRSQNRVEDSNKAGASLEGSPISREAEEVKSTISSIPDTKRGRDGDLVDNERRI